MNAVLADCSENEAAVAVNVGHAREFACKIGCIILDDAQCICPQIWDSNFPGERDSILEELGQIAKIYAFP